MHCLYVCGCSAEEYVRRKLWLRAEPPDCPWCSPADGCTLVPHGFYERLHPEGARVRRFRCKQTGRTVSMLPDCLASHWPGTVEDMEKSAAKAESKSPYKVAKELAKPNEPDNALVRWVSRRVQVVAAFLDGARGLNPPEFRSLQPMVSDFRQLLGTDRVLVKLRHIAGDELCRMDAPIGLRRGQVASVPESEGPHNRCGDRGPPMQCMLGPEA